MNEYYEIKAALIQSLEKAGLSQAEEKISPEVFSSAYAVFSGKNLNYRIVWDGKDGCGYIQSLEKEGWVNLKSTAPRSEHAAFEAAIFRMRIALVEHIALAKLNLI